MRQLLYLGLRFCTVQSCAGRGRREGPAGRPCDTAAQNGSCQGCAPWPTGRWGTSPTSAGPQHLSRRSTPFKSKVKSSYRSRPSQTRGGRGLCVGGRTYPAVLASHAPINQPHGEGAPFGFLERELKERDSAGPRHALSVNVRFARTSCCVVSWERTAGVVWRCRWSRPALSFWRSNRDL